MIFYRTQRSLQQQLLRLANYSRPQNVTTNYLAPRGFASKRMPTPNQIPKYLALLGFGAASYYLFDRYRQTSSGQMVDTGLGQTEASVNLDLNEIYEKTAVVFLSNPEVLFALLIFFGWTYFRGI